MGRHKVVLYNPRAAFFTMPLGALAIASALDRARYDVVIVDGRLERDPVARVLAEADGALCVAMSVLTGSPIADALVVTRAVRGAFPACRIVWGGWHSSLFPAETLDEARLDAVVVGQGEASFAELLARMADGGSLDGVPGTLATGAHGREPLPRPMADVNTLPRHDYALLDVERYFGPKGVRQLDYVTSQGCRFRCAFCADPSVYRRAWSGLEPGRVGEELAELQAQYNLVDVGFLDETFFTHGQRVAAIAEQFLSRGLSFSWMATLRADQGARLDEAVLASCRAAGLRRVLVGLESGSQEMLDWMKKDTRLEHVFATAEKCRRHGVGALFNLIVGFPGEPADSVLATLRVAKQLRRMGPDFQVAIFYYRPYPGSEIADRLAREGHPLPRRLEDWATLDDDRAPSPWVDATKRELVERFRFYQRVAWARPVWWRAPVQAIARWRCDRDAYAFSLEKTVIEWLRPSTQS